MPDTDSVNCAQVEAVLKQGAMLTAEQAAHVRACEECREAWQDAWLDVEVTAALEAKPSISIPLDFAARVAANLPKRRRVKRRWQHWGLLTASLIVAVLLLVAVLAHPHSADTLIGQISMGLVAAEIAGIALWLGQRASV